MRVLMVSAAILPFWRCGVATVVDEIAMRLQKQGHTVGMFALDILGMGDCQVNQEGKQCWLTPTALTDKCAYIPENSRESMHVVERFRECLEQFRPDVVHFHTPRYFCLCLIELAKKAQARVVMTLHDWWWICPAQFYAPELGKRCKAPVEENCLKCMKKTEETQEDYSEREAAIAQAEKLIDCFTCVSSILFEDLVRFKPHLKEKTVVIPNPVSAGVEHVPSIQGPMTFAFLGGQTDIKGYLKVIEAFGALPTEKEWQLNIYGCAVSAEPIREQVNRHMLSKIRRYALHPRALLRKMRMIIKGMRVAKGKEEAIHHLPAFPKEQRADILAKTHAVLVCSQVQESFSLVAYEAMRNGCCVISTPCGGPTAIVQTGKNGILLPDFSAGELKKAAEYMIDHRDKVEGFRRNALELSRSFREAAEVAEMYAGVYLSGEHREEAL